MLGSIGLDLLVYGKGRVDEGCHVEGPVVLDS